MDLTDSDAERLRVALSREDLSPFERWAFNTALDLRDAAAAFLTQELQFLYQDFVNFLFSVPEIRELIAVIIGESDVPPVDPLFDEPPIDVDNGIAESVTVEIPADEFFILEIGNVFAVGDDGPLSRLGQRLDLEISELSGIVRDTIDRDSDDDDVEQIFDEILTGVGSDNIDFENEPGIDGVELVGLTRESYTIAIEDNDVADLLTFAGAGTAAILADFDTIVDISDGANSLGLVDVATESLVFGDGDANPIFDLVGDAFDLVDVEALFIAATDPTEDRVSLISDDGTSFAVRIENAATEAFDFVVFDGAVDTSAFLIA